MELYYSCLGALSSLSEASGAAQIYGDWGVVKAAGCIGGIISREAVLIVPLLSLLWDESSHLIVISFPENLIDGLLRHHTVDSPFLQDLVIVAGRWFEDVFRYAWD